MSQPNGPPPSPPSVAAATCASCGAPDDGEAVICRFCKHAVSAEAQRTAIPCPNPQCRTLCRWGKQKCGACQAWIIVSCVFCGSLSPHNCSSCLRCNEAFAGAPQRKAAMEQQRAHQQNMQAVGTWGHVAAAFAGAAVGSAVSHGVSHHYHHDSCNSCSSPVSSNDFDVSNVIDDIGDIGGGGWDE